MPVSATVKKGLLFDVTRCVGCGACYQACKERNRLPQTTADFLQDPLSDRTFTVVNNRQNRFVRRMCMHCEVPTCVSVCPVGALEKTLPGPVIYHEDRCIGCRYCMLACPFSIPRYEWSKVLPRVRKCDLCADRLSNGQPTACAEVCPTGATLFGEREQLVQVARERLAATPATYQPRIYGLEEVGGTSVLLISDVPMESLGYPKGLMKEPLPLLTWKVLQKIPNFVIAGSALLGGIWWITSRRDKVQQAENHPEENK
jgi:formate dehydrogenase iron-sulfur subunit